MRSLTLLFFTTSAATAASAAAQQPDRPRCRDCTSAEARAAVEARAVQTRDSLRVRGVSLESEIERLAAQLILTSQLQARASEGLQALTARAAEADNRQQMERTARRLQAELQNAARQTQFLRGKLAALCDRSAKPQGYMGITFSATMRADAAASGAEVFRFEENPTVETVEPGSPAERAGVLKGDEILLIAGRDLVGHDIVFTKLLRPGSRLPIRVRRDGETRDVQLLLSERPPALDNGCPFLDARVMAAFGEPFPSPPALATGGIVRMAPAAPNAGGAPSGVVRVRPAEGREAIIVAEGRGRAVAPLSPTVPPVVVAAPNAPEAPSSGRTVFVVGPSVNQMVIAGATIVRPNADLRETFGVKSGVLVLDVARGTPAYASGLKGGDIIVSAGRVTVNSPLAIQRAMQSADERQVELRVVRKQKSQTIVLRW